MLKIGDLYQRVAETNNIPNVLKNKAEDALKFHREIENAQKTRNCSLNYYQKL